MKKFLVVLLSLGLLVAFGATASAADVKFGGGYYVVGVYENNPTGLENSYSHAFFYQRVRLQPVFAIAEGLTFTARMDALEKQWGNTNWKGGTDDTTSSRRNQALGFVDTTNPPATAVMRSNIQGQKIQENFEFERAYVTFMTKIGVFQVGYQNVDDWGTDFGDYSNSRPRIAYSTKLGPVTLSATYEKVFENDTAFTTVGLTDPITKAPTTNNAVDADGDTYSISGIYSGKGVEAGLLYKYYAYNYNRPGGWLYTGTTAPANTWIALPGIKTKLNQISPYAKLTFGPVYVETEATYWFGKSAEYEQPSTNKAQFPALPQDVDLSAWSFYLKGKMNMGPAYFGALFAFSSGDDFSDATKDKSAKSGGGPNFAPALILMNDALNTWTNNSSSSFVPANGGTMVTTSKFNIVLYNAFAGFNPTPKLNLEAALTYATVDKKALKNAVGTVTEAVSDKLGTEFDVKATYKIYDNLTYMVGAGYLWVGDYFKGNDPNKKIDNDYILLNQLTLSF